MQANLSYEIISTTEDKIKSYFWNLCEIDRLNTKLNLLNKHKSQIEADIKNSNIHLFGYIGGVDYSRDNIKSIGLVTSQQDRELDKAFANLEKQKDNIECSIVETNILIRELERKNNDMQHIIRLLSGEAQQFIFLMYKMKKSYTRISNEMNMSKSSVDRYRRQVIYDISKWMCAMF